MKMSERLQRVTRYINFCTAPMVQVVIGALAILDDDDDDDAEDSVNQVKELVDMGQKCKRDAGSDYILRAKTTGLEIVHVACV